MEYIDMGIIIGKSNYSITTLNDNFDKAIKVIKCCELG